MADEDLNRLYRYRWVVLAVFMFLIPHPSNVVVFPTHPSSHRQRIFMVLRILKLPHWQ